MNRLIADDGPRSARLALIGEAGGRVEDEMGLPFVGSSGGVLRKWWSTVGLARKDFFITNAVQRRPPGKGNKFYNFTPSEVRSGIDALQAKIATLDDPWLLAPTGGAALFALLGEPSMFPAVGEKWRLRRIGDEVAVDWPLSIHNLRGSILQYTDRRGRRIKVIPTLHPAATFRMPYFEKRCRADWRRIASDSRFRDLALPERELFIKPTLDDLEAFCADVWHLRRSASPLAIDIETPRKKIITPPDWSWTCEGCGGAGVDVRTQSFTKKKGVILHDACGPVRSTALTKPGKVRKLKAKVEYGEARITCIGFSVTPSSAITIPTTLSYWRDPDALAHAWACIRWLCESELPKVLQNGLFDTFYLKIDHAIDVKNWRWDTMAMHHALDPAEDHDLAFLASMFTREPYWKDEAKDPDEVRRYTDHLETFWRYCGKDAAVTRELQPVLQAALEAA